MSCQKCGDKRNNFGYPIQEEKVTLSKRAKIIIGIVFFILIISIVKAFASPKIIILTILCFFQTGQAIADTKCLTASWYSRASLVKEGTWKDGKEKRMANGKLFNENAFTCASRDFPVKAKLRVTNLKNPSKSVVVEVTDKIGKRFAGKRIDLSRAAFLQIADLKQGLCKVKVEVIQ